MEVPEKLRVAIELAERSERAGGRVGTFAKEIGRLLRALEAELEGQQSPDETTLVARRRKEGLVYSIDHNGETLTERRGSGKSNAFRCPRALYETMVKVLVAADRALAVEEIAAEAAKLLGEPPAEFQIRVALRLWSSINPALINRNRARYRPQNQSFPQKASELWNNLGGNRQQTNFKNS